MSVTATLSLFLMMAALAAMPSASVALVVVQSKARGFRSGVAAALGIAAGDLIFVALAIGGLTVLSELIGTLFALLRYVGAAYLIWLGASLLRQGSSIQVWAGAPRKGGMAVSFLTGVALTLSDVKAIIFYAALFPNLVNMRALTVTDLTLIAVITLLSVGGVKIVYAGAAQAIAERMSGTRLSKPARIAGGGMMIGAGSWLMVKG
ncbi:threonine transporter RhtB [Novosphingobium indicum]|uniref:Threonine transporter RhtB n=1 Tax=Novosphingobium indicum TaxID=462949 RepID=A0ABQ2JX92_9SPHN|nr:LysE family translocator [Novosphingobium indicum]GGN58921.1 threonine transporter RhtB [Novosphingobium indicum]